MAGSTFSALGSRFKGLPRNQQLGILFGIPAVVAVAAGYYGWKALGDLGADPSIPGFLRREGMGKWAEITAVQDQIAEKDKIIKRKPEIEAKIRDLQDDIAAAEERLPREAEKAQMREVIERLAREIPPELGNVKLKSVRITEDAPQAIGGSKRGGLSTVTYQTEIQGDLNGIIKYIDSIEKNTRFMAVNQISFKGGGVSMDAADGKPKVKFEPHSVRMDIVTYVYATGGKVRAQ